MANTLNVVSSKKPSNNFPKETKKMETSENQAPTEVKVHYLYNDLTRCLKRNLNVFIVGPAGSGKTRAVEMAATFLNKDFYCQSVSSQTTLSHLFGYMDANGKYVSTGFRNAFEKGGVFLLDEGDAGNANVITAINSALSNGYCSFPDGMVQRHPDFGFVAAGNTYGTGANRQYVGRNALDAATLDRFVFMEWPYDEELELSMIPEQFVEWVDLVQCYRKAVDQMQIKMIISPRASLNGYVLLDEGFDLEKTEMMAIWKGLDPENIKKVKNSAQKEIEEKKKQRQKSKGQPQDGEGEKQPGDQGESSNQGSGSNGELKKPQELSPEELQKAWERVAAMLKGMAASKQRDPLEDVRR